MRPESLDGPVQLKRQAPSAQDAESHLDKEQTNGDPLLQPKEAVHL